MADACPNCERPLSPSARHCGLTAVLLDGSITAVEPGDTLICACSREAAAASRCHRTWAAYLLHAAGWRVVLDGVEVSP